MGSYCFGFGVACRIGCLVLLALGLLMSFVLKLTIFAHAIYYSIRF